MAVDEFKVIIQAELDGNALNIAGSGFGKAAKKHIQESFIGAALKKDKQITERSLLIKEILDKQGPGTPNKTPNKGDGMLSSMTQTLKGMTSGKGDDIAKSLLKHLGSKAPMILKLGVIGGILLAVYNVLKSLAPIVGLLKLVTVVLQMTLYPIAMFLLNIFKPILFLLLKYVIIPLGSFFGLWEDPNKKGLMDLIGGNSGVDFIDKAYELGTIIGPILVQLGADFGNWLQKIGADFGNWLQELGADFGRFFVDLGIDFGTWVVKMGADFGRWLSETWSNLSVWWYDIKTGFSTWFSDIEGKFNKIVSNVLNISWNDITGEFSRIKFDIVNISWNDITNKFSEMKNNILGISWNDITNIWIDIKAGIVNIFNGIVDSINNIFAKIKWPKAPSWRGGGGGGGSSTTYVNPKYSVDQKYTWSYATGGIANTPQIASIAEKGPEAIIPLDKLKDLIGGGGGNTVNFYDTKVSNGVDIDEIVKKIERILYSNNKRSGAF